MYSEVYDSERRRVLVISIPINCDEIMIREIVKFWEPKWAVNPVEIVTGKSIDGIALKKTTTIKEVAGVWNNTPAQQKEREMK